ncbi:MAG: DUF192 domain-containing protein [Selenomonadaceae bacterium]|nr:DUF192 domain-containing protein [Selenomonadaceae bacterium]
MAKKRFKIENTGKVLDVEIADNFFRRFLGLMGRKALHENEGLLITPCNSIHMLFMRFAIDAVYLDNDFKVLKVTKNLLPWLGFSLCFGAKSVLEVKTGVAEALGIVEGVRLVDV